MAPKKAPPIETMMDRAPTMAELDEMRRLDGQKMSQNGLVRPAGDGFEVFSDTGKYTVSKEDGQTVCNCDDFVGATTIGVPDYKCEHIFAVKHFTGAGKEAVVEEREVVFDQGNIVGEAGDLVDALAAGEEVEVGPGGETVAPNFISLLSRPLPRAMIKQREAKWSPTGFIDYIDWPTVADILDKVCGDNWSFEIMKIDPGEFAVSVHAALIVYGVRRDGVGVAEVKAWDGVPKYELAIKAAASDALKRAAVMFGVARELYSHDDAPAEGGQARPASFKGSVPSNSQRSPVASNIGDMVTTKQLGMIRAICNEAQIDGDEEALRVFRCSVPELSKKAASDFIGHIQAIQRGQTGTIQPIGEPQVDQTGKVVNW